MPIWFSVAICQNSLDAALENGEPTRIEFKTFEIDPHKIPDYSNLEDALKRALDFWSQQQSTKAKTFFKQALDVIHIRILFCPLIQTIMELVLLM